MKNCPNCGALISDGQTSCSICNTPVNSNAKTDNNNPNNSPATQPAQPSIVINSLMGDSAPVEHVYQPLPNINESEKTNKEIKPIEKQEEQQINSLKNNIEVEEKKDTSKPSDEEKKNIMGNILKEREEKNKKEKKDDSWKAAILSIIVIIITIIGGYYAVKLGFNNIKDGNESIMNQVKDQANNYTNIVKDYMRKYDYKTKNTNLNGYYAKQRTFNFLTLPVTGKCILSDGKWIGADDDEVSCQKFFSDINNNYCSAIPCSIPNEAEIYIKETYETIKINDNEETITTGTILDGTTLTYDDVKCSLSSNIYTCEYIEKQDN